MLAFHFTAWFSVTGELFSSCLFSTMLLEGQRKKNYSFSCWNVKLHGLSFWNVTRLLPLHTGLYHRLALLPFCNLISFLCSGIKPELKKRKWAKRIAQIHSQISFLCASCVACHPSPEVGLWPSWFFSTAPSSEFGGNWNLVATPLISLKNKQQWSKFKHYFPDFVTNQCVNQ